MTRVLRAITTFFYEFGSLMAAAPAYLWQSYFLYIPVLITLGFSLVQVRGSRFMYTLGNYTNLLNKTYLKIFMNSFGLAATTALLCLLIGFPVAYFLAVHAKKQKNILLVFLILPSWTSFIIQIYSWFFVLQKGGVISAQLQYWGLTSGHVSLLNNYAATVLGMVYCYLPFMIFPLYTVLEKMDKRLLEASADLGAGMIQTFVRIIVPLVLPGVQVGMFIVFIPAFGEFAIPDLMGGFKDVYVGRVIMEKFLIYRDWNAGAATVMLSILFPLLSIIAVYVLYHMVALLFSPPAKPRREPREYIK